MAHGRVEQQIEALQRLAADGPTPVAAAALRKGLADRVGLVVAKAAQIAAELQLRELLPDMLRAFDRLLENAAERDPQCWGKNAIAKALIAFDHRESEPFLRGARHEQLEPVWGGLEDTAAALRGICVLAVASCTDMRRDAILRFLIDRFGDWVSTVRVEAARAIAQMGGDEPALLLRLIARTGDVEPRVIGQVFDCLLEVEGSSAVDFVAGFIGSGPAERQAEAALSLGTSRLAPALAALEQAFAATANPDLRLAILRGLSASRQESALDFLLGIVRNGKDRECVLALEALALHRESQDIRQRVQAAASDAGSAAEERFRRAFR